MADDQARMPPPPLPSSSGNKKKTKKTKNPAEDQPLVGAEAPLVVPPSAAFAALRIAPPADPLAVPVPEPEIAFDEEAPVNPLIPLDSNPELGRVLCCNKVHHHGGSTEGVEKLIECFTKYGHHYPVDYVNPTCSEDWEGHRLFVGINETKGMTVEMDWYNSFDIYALGNFDKGYFIQYLDPDNQALSSETRPVVLRNAEAMKDTSRDRFYLIPGAGIDFFCPMHEKSFCTYFLCFWAKGEEFNDIEPALQFLTYPVSVARSPFYADGLYDEITEAQVDAEYKAQFG